MSMTNTVTVTVELVPETCCNCGIVFGISSELKAQRKKDRDTFYCPNGHPMVYTGKTEAQKLQDELAATRARLDQAWANVSEKARELEAERRRTAAARGQVTKIRKRVGGGACPCCNRYFPNLHRHMSTQHPDQAHPVADKAGD